jgi:hypothetical protein
MNSGFRKEKTTPGAVTNRPIRLSVAVAAPPSDPAEG